MPTTVIKIRRRTSGSDPGPGQLVEGELGFAFASGKLFIGVTSPLDPPLHIGGVSGVLSLGGLSDVTLTVPVIGEVLTFDGSEWVNAAGGSVSSLDDLSDVTLTVPTTDNVLQFDGSQWVNTASLAINGNIGASGTVSADTLMTTVGGFQATDFLVSLTVPLNVLGLATFSDSVVVTDSTLGTQAFYLGDPLTDGTWRLVRNGSDLSVELRESGFYVSKMTVTP